MSKRDDLMKLLLNTYDSEQLAAKLADDIDALYSDEPKVIDYLKVDENTPKGTLCWFNEKDSGKSYYCGPLRDYADGRATSPYGGRWDSAERFVGVHLLPWEGGECPYDGDVIIMSANGQVATIFADKLKGFDWCRFGNIEWTLIGEGTDIVAWAPWDREKKQVDMDALRKLCGRE